MLGANLGTGDVTWQIPYSLPDDLQERATVGGTVSMGFEAMYSFTNSLLSNYYVSGIVLGAGDTK